MFFGIVQALSVIVYLGKNKEEISNMFFDFLIHNDDSLESAVNVIKFLTLYEGNRFFDCYHDRVLSIVEEINLLDKFSTKKRINLQSRR